MTQNLWILIGIPVLTSFLGSGGMSLLIGFLRARKELKLKVLQEIVKSLARINECHAQLTKRGQGSAGIIVNGVSQDDPNTKANIEHHLKWRSEAQLNIANLRFLASVIEARTSCSFSTSLSHVISCGELRFGLIPNCDGKKEGTIPYWTDTITPLIPKLIVQAGKEI